MEGLMKRLISIFLVVAMLLALSVTAIASRSGLHNFRSSGSYNAGQFNDVSGLEWFAEYVENAYNHGLMRGRSGEVFAPRDMITYGEAVALAVRLRRIYFTGSSDLAESVLFYAVYSDYARRHGITGGAGDYAVPATRAQFAELIHNALPLYMLAAINDIPDYGISDVGIGHSFHNAVYTLYRAGVLNGCYRFGSFRPSSHITRSEAAAIMTRVVVPSARIEFDLPTRLSVEDIFERSADAVFKLEMFDSEGYFIRTGSGFFITDAGHAVTNLHVLDHAVRAIITLADGRSFPVRGVHAFCFEDNLAIISIDTEEDEVWSYLTLANSDRLETGAAVYVIGSPYGLINSITAGIISNARRELDGTGFVQFTAPISFGSGGSPLLNELGQVVGVASSSFPNAQNINLAVPVNLVMRLEVGNYITLEDFHYGEDDYYFPA